MTQYQLLAKRLKSSPRHWLITGVAGFIGSNLLETLLNLGQRVTGLDNFSTGSANNLKLVEQAVSPENWKRFKFVKGSTLDLKDVRLATTGVDYVLHQAALGSVPRSIKNPAACHEHNVTGFLNVAIAARDARARRFVYASSSSVYGDSPRLPKVESEIGKPLSPYAASKLMNEVYAQAFASAYKFQSIGLRYFNVFGPRQDPYGAYAALIPCWISAMLAKEPVYINGDGRTSRDFCYVTNVVQANLLAATVKLPDAVNQVYNIAVGERTTLLGLYQMLQRSLRRRDPSLPEQAPAYRDFRAGDVRHSLADIRKARKLLGYVPTVDVRSGIEHALEWYCRNA